MSSQDPADLRTALQGDREAFDALTEPHRGELQVHCYRMLGSLVDAEDLVQETLLRAWKGRRTYAGRASVRAWLYRIATNACLDELAARPRRGLPTGYSPPADPNRPPEPPRLDPIWLEPYPDALLPSATADVSARHDARESVRLAFMVALQTLPPRQRAVLLLRDVLGWKTSEVASLLGSSPSSVMSALYRARGTLSAQKWNEDRAAREAVLDREAEQQQLNRYVRAWETADIDGLTALLKEDATFPMPPLPGWYRGQAAIRAFVAATVLHGDARGRWRLVPTRANGCPAFGLYRKQEDRLGHAAFGIQVVTIDGGRIADATTFGFPQLLRRFGLPDTV